PLGPGRAPAGAEDRYLPDRARHRPDRGLSLGPDHPAAPTGVSNGHRLAHGALAVRRRHRRADRGEQQLIADPQHDLAELLRALHALVRGPNFFQRNTSSMTGRARPDATSSSTPAKSSRVPIVEP